MNFEPPRFFIGLIDFFSILLPGALLTYLLKDDVGPHILGDSYAALVDSEGWAVFLFGSYLLGHFIFLLGSFLDELYDLLRKGTYVGQISQLAEGESLSSSFTRWLAAQFFKKDAEQAVRKAVAIKMYYLDPLHASSAINAFQWCKAKLALRHPEALATVQRFEADSKFFRSLVVVLIILFLWGVVLMVLFLSGIGDESPSIAVCSVPVLVLAAFWRYVDQRAKSTNQAYWYIITLEGERDGSPRQSSSAQNETPSHAGGVVYRQVGQQVEFLLVQAKQAPQEWVLPKGHIEPGERMEESAVREVREETGVWARIKAELDGVEYSIAGKPVTVQYYLMEALEEGKPSDENRKHVWLKFDEAVSQATHKESKALLRLAEEQRSRL